jgi:polysaccharide biosynthesis transport protein
MSIVIKRELPSDEASWQESQLQRSQSETLNPGVKLSGSSNEEGGLDLDLVIKAIQRRWWIVAIACVVTSGVSMALSRTKPPAYEGSFNILIEPVTAEGQVASAINNGDRTSSVESDLGSAQSSKTTLDYPTQIQILLSDKILNPVVKQLKTTNPKISYESLRASLTIDRLKDQSETKILKVNYHSTSEGETKQVLKLVSDTYIQYSLRERQTNVRRAIKFVDTQLPTVRTQVRDLELALQTFREKHQLIDPSTLGTQLGSQTSTTRQEQSTTQVELAKAKQLYKSLEQQIQLQPKGAEAASVLSEAPGYQQLVEQLRKLDAELQIQSAELTEENPKIISLRAKRANLLPLLKQTANSALGSKLSGSIPNAQSLPYQNALRQDLSKQLIAAATQVKVLEAKLTSLNLASQTLSGETGQLPVISRQYETLQRQLKIATERLSKFLQKREELTIDAARQEVPWELIASPSVRSIASSGIAKDLALGGVLGLLVGAGIALVVDKMNNVIYSLKNLREELDLPILGMIPNREDELKSNDPKINQAKWSISGIHKKDSININNRYRFSPFIESFRALNSQIRLLSPDTPIRSIVVSSSLPDEGKTTIAIQLAQAAAAMGQRVLLVNADLRKPSLQNLVDRHNRTDLIHGLTDIIAGNSKLMDTVQLLPGEENLYILLSGSISLDPTNILSSKRMKDLMKTCERNFDLVIYDTVPLNFADSLLLIPHTDGLLMVSRLGRVHREVLRQSIETLAVSKVNVLGLVVNMVADPQYAASAYYSQTVVPV